MKGPARPDPRVRAHLDEVLAEHVDLAERIGRTLLIALHSRGIVSIDEIHHQARDGQERTRPHLQADNVQVGHRWDQEERHRIHQLTLDYAAGAFSREEIDDIVNLTRKREEAQSLEEVANLSSVSFGLLRDRVKAFCRLPQGQTTLPENESIAVRVSLIRRFISEQLEFIGIAKQHLRIRDFDDLVDRILGDEEGEGLIGGKAAGLVLAGRILERAAAEDPQPRRPKVHSTESFFLRSDVIEDFLRLNGLQHLQDHKYKDIEEIRREFPMILELFKNADFPRPIVEQVGGLLERVGTHPLIVRSSSLLEDRFGTAFAGKYRSVFVSNQGTPRERLEELLGAIAEVYASTLHPDPIRYRRRHHLLDYSENMAVLVQKLVGRRLGRFFLPSWAGVAFSWNAYRRNPRIRPEDGLARLVLGLGTRAVDRVSADFPRMVPLGLPSLRPEVKTADVVQVSQREVDVIDLAANRFRSISLTELLAEGGRLPGAAQVLSRFEHGFLRPLMGDNLVDRPEDHVVTFDGWTRSSPWPAFLRWCLQRLEEAYGCPVDIEFACDGEDFTLLQCRPQAVGRTRDPVHPPAALPAERRIFSARRDVLSGSVHDIEWLVLIDPRDYNRLSGDSERLEVARVVRRLNERLAATNFVLMGPGRWGSRDLRMGIRVGYADISNTRVLIEIARLQEGYLPEVSFGSHFFQDLVESDILYLPLYPDDPECEYNDRFLQGAPNALTELLPEEKALEEVVRVLHVPAATGGLSLHLDMDGEHQEALAYLGPQDPA